eukprot:CAMPEP_0170376018 /NCGR_PEP_ID=MMETSP0117_2-20130122/11478_1 /TAXON_ID=400756 /ORGANISM="Durinskia baltica, Strain CSIRO CS-38" /LENGTH=173 /DNA_ID=CAMNT_0010631147 /DNA_START=93 /DNA_END=612 /DNA_ORIENTATION=-
MAAASQELIRQLLQAEKEAEEVIAGAKRNRLAKLKQARDKAEEDLKVFKEEQERKFQKDMGGKAAADPTAELKSSTQQQLDSVNRDYQANKDRAIQYILGRVLDVPTQLTDTQKQALKMGTDERERGARRPRRSGPPAGPVSRQREFGHRLGAGRLNPRAQSSRRAPAGTALG